MGRPFDSGSRHSPGDLADQPVPEVMTVMVKRQKESPLKTCIVKARMNRTPNPISTMLTKALFHC